MEIPIGSYTMNTLLNSSIMGMSQIDNDQHDIGKMGGDPGNNQPIG